MGGPMNGALIVVVALCLAGSVASRGGWSSAHATYYGDMRGAETLKGSCGYLNTMESGYGHETAALSTALFHGGLTCGACYEMKCHNSPRWCLNNTIHVTATNLCPSSRQSGQNWCNLPNQHFDLSQPVFGEITNYEAGFVPILYCRALLVRSGGVKFEIERNSDWILVLVYNVGGAGNVKEVKVKGSGSEWIQMEQNWGQNWQCSAWLVGQSLSFQVTTSDGKMVQSHNVAPADWKALSANAIYDLRATQVGACCLSIFRFY